MSVSSLTQLLSRSFFELNLLTNFKIWKSRNRDMHDNQKQKRAFWWIVTGIDGGSLKQNTYFKFLDEIVIKLFISNFVGQDGPQFQLKTQHA